MERSLDPVDRLALRGLVDAYATLADTRDFDGFVALFTADGALVIGQAEGEPMRFSGPQLHDAVSPVAQYRATMHLVANHEARRSDGGASGTTYCLANHLRDSADGGVENYRMTIRYDDEYASGDDGWRFASRTLHILWTEVVPASTGRLEL